MEAENNPFKNQIFTDPSDESNVVNLQQKQRPQSKKQAEPEPPPEHDIPVEAYEEVQPEPDAEPTGKRKFTFTSGSDLFTAKPIRWLVRGAIELDNFVGMYGASGSGKSFAAVDMGLCIATGQPWHGHKVKAGKVVYVAGEGKAGIKRRITAWAQRHSGHDQVAQNFMLSDSVCLLPDDTEAFIDSLRELPELRLLVLDTLQRTYQGDENSTRDMTAYVQAIDSIRTAIPDLVVMVVHHTGHGAGDRARGSSVLKASLDSEIKVEQRGKHRVIEHTKAKESEPFKPMAFELKSEILDGWKGEEGEPVSSATLHLDSDFDFSQKKGDNSAPTQTKALRLLDELLNGHTEIEYSKWMNACISAGLADKPFRFKSNIAKRLETKGSIVINGDIVTTQQLNSTTHLS